MKTTRLWLALCGLFFFTQHLSAAVQGYVEVTITPSGANSNGAAWEVDSGLSIASGLTTNTIVGSHTISFTSISNWTTPSNQLITVTGGMTNFLTATYVLQFNYITNADNTLTITGPTNAAGSIAIPASINGLTVTAIGSNAFEGATALTSVTLPDNLAAIGSNAFFGCTVLTNIVFDSSLTNIGPGAFEGSGLISVAVPDGVTGMGDRVFQNCNQLLNASLGNGLPNTGNYAFQACSLLTNVTLGTNLAVIGTNAFYQTALANIVIPNSVLNICDDAFEALQLTNATIGIGVTNIGASAFAECLLPTFVIPGNVKTIQAYAFEGCHFTNLTISSGVASVGSNAFEECYLLTNLAIPGSVTNIGFSAFAYMEHLTHLTLGEGIETIGDEAFLDCSNIDSLFIPGTVVSIGEEAFAASYSATNITLENGIRSINTNAFEYCTNVLSLEVPGSVTNLGPSVFYECYMLENVILDTGITVVPANTFYDDTNLTGVTLPNTLTNIGATAFQDCALLKTISIPASVATVGTNAFQGCTNLRTVYFEGDAPTAASTAFSGVPGVGFYFSGTTGWSSTLGGLPVVLFAPPTGTIAVTILPAGAVTAGATFQVDGGTNQDSGTVVSNLAIGVHVVTFGSITNWTSPTYQLVTVAAGSNTAVTGLYIQQFGSLQVTISPAAAINAGAEWQLDDGSNEVSGTTLSNLVPGAHTVSFLPVTGLVTPSNEIVTVLASQTILTNGAYGSTALPTNYLLTAEGSYNGLFAPASGDRTQTNSGAFEFTLAKSGVVSGKLLIGAQTVALAGKFGTNGVVQITSVRHGMSDLTTTLQLEPDSHAVTGTVTDGAFTNELTGYQSVFSVKNKATNYEGDYTLIIAGTTNAAMGPFGTSYGTVTVNSAGAISFRGSLADGTAVSQTSVVSSNGYWPLYLSLYGGKGSLLGWNLFTNQTIVSAPELSWINGTNTTRTGAYRAGFTNDQAVLTGELYDPSQTFSAGMVTLEQTNPPVSITVTNIAGNTNKLTLKTTKATGLISGSFANPTNSRSLIKINGVILQGETNAQGYFLNGNQSGTVFVVPGTN